MRHAAVILALSLGFLLAACGGGGSTGPEGLQLNVYQPDFLFSNSPGEIRLLGTGFGVRRTPVIIRYTADAGTPFLGGTSATLEVAGLTDSDRQIRGTAPATFVPRDVDAFVTVVLPNGTEVTSAEAVAGFTRQSVLDLTVNGAVDPSVPSGSTPPYVITGTGFQPLTGLATITFTAVSGTPFLAGGSATLTTSGLIETTTSISGLLNDAKVTIDTQAFVSVTLPGGTKIDSPTALIEFTPIPTVSSFAPNVVAGGTMPPFVVNGTAFEGTSVAVTLIAASGTPFLDGTTNEVLILGSTIDTAQVISGMLPDLNPSEAGVAFVKLDFGGTGATAISELPVFSYVPAPVITSFSPSVIASGNPSPCAQTAPDTNFTITGTDLGSSGTSVLVTFTAISGTPFQDGTASSFTSNATANGPTSIQGMFPDPVSDADVGVTVSIAYDSGATDDSAPTKLSDVVVADAFVAPTVFDLSISGSLLAGGAQNDDGFSQVTFPAMFSPSFFGVANTSVFVNSNGCLTFGAGDTDFGPTTAEFANDVEPRIAPWWADLSPQLPTSGEIRSNTTGFTDRIVITYFDIREFDNMSAQLINAQVILHDTGRIDMVFGSYGTASGGIVGIGPGGGAALNLVDLSSAVFSAAVPASTTCGTAATARTTIESFTGTYDLANAWMVFYPDGAGGYVWTTASN